MTFPQETDEWLVEVISDCQIKQGRPQRAAWSRLAKVVLPWLQQVAIWEVTTMRRRPDPHLAEDMAIEVFIKLQENIHKIYDPKGLFHWLRSVLRNKLLDTLRFGFFGWEIPTQTWEIFDAPTETDLDFLTFERKKRAKALHVALNKLSEDRRQLLYMSYWQGMSNAEIAQELGVKAKPGLEAKVIKDRIARTREALRKILLSQGFEP
jgi:RNA polymerase sigma factor (sigma-70 family)